MKLPQSLEPLQPYLVDEPPLLKTAHAIQILVLRQTHDFTIFRTEETRELNIVTLPRSTKDSATTIKVAMLATKQKAPESRAYVTLLRTAAAENKVDLEDEIRECYLKDNLCRSCPRCTLFGAVTTERGRAAGGDRWNIKHRIEYSTAYSIEPYEDISEILTFNAVSDATQSTGQALGVTENIQPMVNFPSVITLNSVTQHELIAYLKTLMGCKSYGAETRVKGDTVNHILGIAAGYEELITSLEFNLELSSVDLKDDLLQKTNEILQKYAKYAAFRDKALVLSKRQMESILEDVRELPFNKAFISEIYTQSKGFKERIETKAGEERKRGVSQ